MPRPSGEGDGPRRLDGLTLDAAALLARARHLRPQLVPGEEPPAAAVAARIVEMSAEERRELGRRLRERLAAEA